MFTEIEVNTTNVEDIYAFCLDKLDDSMLILKNNSKVLRFLTDEELSEELGMAVKSLSMALRHARFELVQNILLGMKDNVHKLAALEIRYFDENESLLRVDLYNAFVAKNLKKHAFISPKVKELLDVLDKTITLSPTNAALAIRAFSQMTALHNIYNILEHASLSNEFKKQIYKRFEANFGMTIDENFEKFFAKNKKMEKFSLKQQKEPLRKCL